MCRKKVKKSGYRLNEDALGESLPGAEMGVIFNPSVPTRSKFTYINTH